jgi:2-keto-4-pentenoate hydratase/2-oxohepta-3-ene-1,7-dioic acid hydratase in catechol pathway
VKVDQSEIAALFVDDAVFDISKLVEETGIGKEQSKAFTGDRMTVLGILQDWDTWEPLLAELADAAGKSHAGLADVSLLPPVPRPGKVLGVGANYRDHLEEMNADAPSRPYLFLKPAGTTQIGSGQALEAPRDVQWLDWEAELAFVMGRRVRNGSADAALAAVAGYMVANDVSARDCMADALPPLGMDWLRHKGYDGFTPIGPAITPASFVPDPQDLAIELSVNGEMKQRSHTSKMITTVADIIVYASTITTLEPGDVVLTGTPAGVGFGQEPRERLSPGDSVTVKIDRLGTITTPVK